MFSLSARKRSVSRRGKAEKKSFSILAALETLGLLCVQAVRSESNRTLPTPMAIAWLRLLPRGENMGLATRTGRD